LETTSSDVVEASSSSSSSLAASVWSVSADLLAVALAAIALAAPVRLLGPAIESVLRK
jgi:hypothetical protein